MKYEVLLNNIVTMESLNSLMITTLLLCLMCIIIHGYNIDISSPVIHFGEEGSLFGYSVAMHRENGQEMLLIGAPRLQTSQPGVQNAGGVYRCSAFQSSNPQYRLRNSSIDPHECQFIPFDKKGQPMFKKRVQAGNKTRQMFGATVLSAGPDESVVACAPRYVRYPRGNKHIFAPRELREPIGVCFIASQNFSTIISLKPCKSSNNNEDNARQRQCQAGFSAAISEEKTLILGAPGSFSLQGRVFVSNLAAPKSYNYSYKESNDTDDNYKGYSVTYGDLNNDNKSDIVVGAPRRENLSGSVLVFNDLMVEIISIRGDQLAAYFGHSIAVADYDGDGLDDLVVGAPMYTDNTQGISLTEVGQIYVYYQHHMNGLCQTPQRIRGHVVNGRFGFTLTVLGDIDSDGFTDLAVSAPYEGIDSEGAVYIYKGHTKGIRSQFSQIIRPSEVDPSMRITGFGFSMSGNYDIDHNGFKDLLIGAPHSSTAMMFRSRPIIRLKSAITFSVDGIMYRQKNKFLPDGRSVCGFNVTSCIQFSGDGISTRLGFTCELQADVLRRPLSSRALIIESNKNSDHSTLSFTLSKNETYCQTLLAFTGNIREFSPIGFQLQCSTAPVQTVHNTSDVKPIIQGGYNSSYAQIPFFVNCTSDPCRPDLELYAVSNTQSLYIGNSSNVTISVSVRSHAEDAYDAKLYVILPDSFQFVGVKRTKSGFLVTCGPYNELNVLSCELGNPLTGDGTEVSFSLTFMMDNLTGDDDVINIHMIANSSGLESMDTSDDNDVVISFSVLAEVIVVFYGTPKPPSLKAEFSTPSPTQYYPNQAEAVIGPEVTHTYEVKNVGLSDIASATLTVWWPMKTDDGDYLLYLLSSEISTGDTCTYSAKLNPKSFKLTSSAENISNAFLTNLTESVYLSKGAVNERSKRNSPTPNSVLVFSNYSCTNHERNCYVITCNVQNMRGSGQRDVIFLKLRSRVWRPTIAQFDSYDIRITSSASFQVKSLPYAVQPKNFPDERAEVTVVVIPEVHLLQDEELPIWLIVGSAICGMILLSFIITCMIKIGFFRRSDFHKMPKEISAPIPL